jgi:hypothetical protein
LFIALSKRRNMKIIGILITALILSTTGFSQSDDLPIDESLIIKLAKVASGGYLSKSDLKNADELTVNEKEAVVIGFYYKCDKTGYQANIYNEGPQLSKEILNHMNSLKIGSKVVFDNIKIENASGEVLAKPLLLTIKS